MKIMNNKSLLNIHNLVPVSCVNGPGRRAVVWTQGCSKRCAGCSNPLTHSHKPRMLLNAEPLADTIVNLPSIEGATISGGEPLEQPDAVGRLCRLIRQKGLSVMLFTGWEFEQIHRSNDQKVRQLLSQIDILVSGPFVKRLANKDLIWRGSSNQQITFLTDRYSPDILNDRNPTRVEGLLATGTPLQITGFPADSDITVLTERLVAEAGILREPTAFEDHPNSVSQRVTKTKKANKSHPRQAVKFLGSRK